MTCVRECVFVYVCVNNNIKRRCVSGDSASGGERGKT